MNEQTNQKFNYTYSAEQQGEIDAIRKKYLPPEKKEMDKMEQLRALDANVSKKAMSVSLTIGIIGALIMGIGMSLIMTNIGAMINLNGAFVLGLVVGVIGLLAVISAYPVYQYVLKKERERIAPQILKLAEELSIQ